jgi:4-hydroxy-3-methylbut-2-enyl diphosphate reductase
MKKDRIPSLSIVNYQLSTCIDPGSGFCFGVVNAITKAEEGLSEGREVYSLGDIVHNRMEVQRLEKLGLHVARHGDLGGLAGKTLLIRAHGEPPSTYRVAGEAGMDIIDATCPVVARLQAVVADAYRQMQACGGQVVLLGKRGHAEVVGLAGQAGGDVTVVEGKEDLDAVDFSRPVFFLSQTTQSLDLFGEMSGEIMRRAEDPAAVTVKDTICRQVSSREANLREFAGRFDTVIFVAGRKSSNGKVLLDVCRQANPSCRHIEESGELRPEWFEGVSSVGICGATSTPQWLMEDVADAIKKLSDNQITPHSTLQTPN